LDVGYQGSETRKLERIVGLNRVFNNSGTLSPPIVDWGRQRQLQRPQYQRKLAAILVASSLAGKYQFSRVLTVAHGRSGRSARSLLSSKPEMDYGPSDFIVTHNLLFSGLYDLPIFKSRHDFVGKAFGGWNVSGTFQFHTGFPWSPVESNQLPADSFRGALCPALVASYLGGAKNDFSTDTFKSNHGQFPGIVTGGNCPTSPAPGVPPRRLAQGMSAFPTLMDVLLVPHSSTEIPSGTAVPDHRR